MGFGVGCAVSVANSQMQISVIQNSHGIREIQEVVCLETSPEYFSTWGLFGLDWSKSLMLVFFVPRAERTVNLCWGAEDAALLPSTQGPG